ncbi:MAG: hypothetical protein ACLFNJ_00420 [Bacteroidales bacterium]
MRLIFVNNICWKLFSLKKAMYILPYKHIRLKSQLSSAEVLHKITQITDQDQKSIYWGKRFYKKFSGEIGERNFLIRPVVPYWNISPVEIEGRFISENMNESTFDLRIICPYLRFVIPLGILAVVLFFFNYRMTEDATIFLSSIFIVVFTAYLLVNIPFQIQAKKSLNDLLEITEGKEVRES